MAQVDGAAWTYFAHDHLGSPRMSTDASKNVTGRQEYTPYGEIYASVSPGTTRGYTGHDYDAVSGLYFAPFRYYAPGLNRWLTPDPLGMVDGPNMYGYVGGNPIMGADPLGLESWWQNVVGWFGGHKGDWGDVVLCAFAKYGVPILAATAVGGLAGQYVAGWTTYSNTAVGVGKLVATTRGLGLGSKVALGAGATVAVGKTALEKMGYGGEWVYNQLSGTTLAASTGGC